MLEIPHKLFSLKPCLKSPQIIPSIILLDISHKILPPKICLMSSSKFSPQGLPSVWGEILRGDALGEISIRISIFRFIICLRSWSNLAQKTSLKLLDSACYFLGFLKGFWEKWTFGCVFCFCLFFFVCFGPFNFELTVLRNQNCCVLILSRHHGTWHVFRIFMSYHWKGLQTTFGCLTKTTKVGLCLSEVSTFGDTQLSLQKVVLFPLELLKGTSRTNYLKSSLKRFGNHPMTFLSSHETIP